MTFASSFFFLFGMIWSSGLWAAEPAKDGVIDLRGQRLDVATDLRGDWEFYWDSFIDPNAFPSTDVKRALIKVPALWTQAPEKYPTYGFATYRLEVQLDRAEEIALFFPASIWSSSIVFVEGQEIVRFGTIGKTRETSIGGQNSKLYTFTPKKDRFDIVVQVANFEIFLAGINTAPSIGYVEALNYIRFKKFCVEIFLFGALFIMGIYHICLFSLRRSDPSTLFFGLMCLGVGVYLLVTRDGVLMTLMPDLSLGARLKLYNLSWMSSVPMFTWFAHYIFRENYHRWVAIGASIITLGYSILIVSTHHRTFVSLTLGYQGVTIAVCFYSLAMITRAWIKKVEGAGIFLSGVLFMFVAALVDIMSVQGYINVPPMGGFGLFAFIFFQSYMIARRFSFAFKRLKISEKAIRKLSDDLKNEHNKVMTLNANLERSVEEKTRDIRSIMEHIPLGIFMIKQDFHIHKDHSRHLQDILIVSNDQLEKAVATDLLFEGTTLTSDARSQATSALQSTLGESALNFEVNAHTLPVEIRQEAKGRSRVFDVTWNVIEDADSHVDKMLVTLRDVTELRKLQERSKDQQEELEFIGEILNISSERFLRFIQSCQSFIQENDKLIHSQSMQKQNLEVLKVLFINMHTIKGAARSLYFKKMTQVFHDVEQYYATLQKDKTVSWDLSRMERDLKEASRIVGIYEKIAREKLGRASSQVRRVEFPLEIVEGMYREICETIEGQILPVEVSEMIARVKDSLHTKIFKNADIVFGDLVECLPVLARDLHKECPAVEMNNQGFLLSEKAEETFRRIFVHLLRNSMDHGIETAEERVSHGKAAKGQITVLMEKRGHRLLMTYQDDGRGLHVPRIREIGLARGLLKDNEKYPAEVVAELIFDSGLSTANQVSDISGRGVGMDAVRRFIGDAGGQIHIHLGEEKPGGFYPFQFLIDLPFSIFEESGDRRTDRAA